jgi:hypothetical protein
MSENTLSIKRRRSAPSIHLSSHSTSGKWRRIINTIEKKMGIKGCFPLSEPVLKNRKIKISRNHT